MKTRTTDAALGKVTAAGTRIWKRTAKRPVNCVESFNGEVSYIRWPIHLNKLTQTGQCISYLTIGHFRVSLCLCFKTSPSAKRFTWKWVWLTWKWLTWRRNTFTCECFRTKTRFDTEAIGFIWAWRELIRPNTSYNSHKILWEVVDGAQPEWTIAQRNWERIAQLLNSVCLRSCYVPFNRSSFIHLFNPYNNNFLIRIFR